ncbi:MAG TPA: DUF6531 domain-containing protein [Pseudonocardiaceae bacterium]|nr:DUF6531 domain-containing protein [Pseudonocardiaceae bacterium]
MLSAGPPLAVQRSYNSKDPRVTGAFGAGWSAVLDARAVEQPDATGSVQSVVVTYPDGAQVGFGRNSDGSFSPPQSRYVTMAAVTGGGYSLTDKNQTVYRFTQPLSTGSYGITSITDANGRAVSFGYTAGQLTSMTSGTSGRVLHLTSTTPPGARAAHVVSIATDPAVTGDSTTVQTWTYTYSADQLTKVCPPTSSTACTVYGYTPASQYPNTVQDLGARSYWRLNEASGATAASSVLANLDSDDATYQNVTLGTPGPLPGSTATAASFTAANSSYVDLTGGQASKAVIVNSQYQSMSLWFKTSTPGGVLFSYQADPITNSTSPGNYVPALYVGTDGKLYGEFWYSGGT